ncbi:VOC family protein [Streptomyces sp. NPDC090075]|uniref:VOC family protein n=1 Tax=Streptomyces sp. NPDC090075 TaxID=3365937 RepID=UPI0037F8C0D7
MKKQVRRTGDHGIGQLTHVVHMSDDAQELRRFYEDVLGACVYFGVDEPHYLSYEDRYATLLMIGDLCVETMAPRMPADTRLPVGRFYTKYGRHLHSVGYQVDDLAGLADRLLERGIHIAKPGGGMIEHLAPETPYFFPSPRDTAGLMVEFCGTDMPGDPRDQETWSVLERMRRPHPLTIERFSHVTLGVRDLSAAVRTYIDVMQAVPVGTGMDADLAAKYVMLQLGDGLLQLAEPVDADSDLGRHVDTWGNMIYGLRFKVTDLDSAEGWFDKKSVRTARIRRELLVTDVEDTFGAPLFFGTEEVEGHPLS